MRKRWASEQSAEQVIQPPKVDCDGNGRPEMLETRAGFFRHGDQSVVEDDANIVVTTKIAPVGKFPIHENHVLGERP